MWSDARTRARAATSGCGTSSVRRSTSRARDPIQYALSVITARPSKRRVGNSATAPFHWAFGTAPEIHGPSQSWKPSGLVHEWNPVCKRVGVYKQVHNKEPLLSDTSQALGKLLRLPGARASNGLRTATPTSHFAPAAPAALARGPVIFALGIAKPVN